MKWSVLLNSADKQEYSEVLNNLLMSDIVRKTKRKTFLFPLEGAKTQYEFCVEVSFVVRNIVNRIFSKVENESIILKKSNFVDLIVGASFVGAAGMSPFGVFGERAIRNWFENNMGRICYNETPVSVIFSEKMKRDFISYNSCCRAFRTVMRYNDDKRLYPDKLLASLINSQGKNNMNGCFFSETEELFKMHEALSVKNHNHPVSFIIEAALYIVSVTSFLAEIVSHDVIDCAKIITGMRYTEDFYEDTDEDEYNEFASLVKCFEKCREKYEYDNDKEAIFDWCAYAGNVMSRIVADAFLNNYKLIMSGKYDKNLIESSWCRTFKRSFETAEKYIMRSADKILLTEVDVFNKTDRLLDKFINAVLYYDTEKEITDMKSKLIINLIPKKYKKVYEQVSAGKKENEKLYHRFMMVLDYIYGMTDDEAENLSQKLR